jgi:hypothetical protein
LQRKVIFDGGLGLKIRILVLAALVLVVLGTAGLWMLSSLPRARTGSNPRGFTALDQAARAGRTDTIRELARAGADVELRDSGPNGWTPLLHAVHKGQLGSVRALIAAGADPDGRGDNGLTPLMLAAAQGEPEIVAELLKAGANPRLRGPVRWTALEQAVANAHPKVVDVLLRKDPGLRLGHGPRGWAIRVMAWVQGHPEAFDRIDRREEVR